MQIDTKHEKEIESFDRMLSLMEQVRKECPWDKSQTNDTLRTLTIEEMYELSEAILQKNDTEIKKELGDVLMHVVFYSLIANEKKEFDIKDVMDSLSEKLIRRHHHVFQKDKNFLSYPPYLAFADFMIFFISSGDIIESSFSDKLSHVLFSYII